VIGTKRRHSAKIKVENVSAAQRAVYDLALRHMLDPNKNKVRPDLNTDKVQPA
jgi:hypothetical protein